MVATPDDAEGHPSPAPATSDWRIVADVRCDIDHLDDEQVLRLAQIYFDEAPRRDAGDNRRGAAPLGDG